MWLGKKMSPHAKIHAADMGALVAMLGSFWGLLPGIAALLAAIWYAVQIWESKTARRLTGRDKDGD